MKSLTFPPAPAPALIDQVNILIVDDEPKNLTVLESILDDPGYRLVRANSGQEALLALMAEEFAVLVLDVRMPGMTGFELAQIIKERKKTSRVPIIFLTAYYNEDQHILEGYGTGAVDYLHKPVNTAVLRSKVAVFAELFSKGRALEAANRTLMTEVGERRKAEERLRELNETLDRRVTERTNTLELREAELRDANRRKDEFLATLAHELRNPLAPVRNAVQLLRLKGQAMPELQWGTDVIDRQIKAMSRLIDDLMDVSRINQGKIDLRHDWVTTEDVLRDAVESSRPLIDECGHELVLTLPDQRLSLYADRTRLTQAFMNLLNNAAKYMDRGGRIEVTAQHAGNDVVVTVKDKGIGIPGDRLQSVFEMFSQVETTLTRSRGGLGIGLSLTQRLIEMHGGTVLARSEGSGLGSEFEVRLPLTPELSPEVSSPPSQDLGVERFMPSQELRVLIADDNQDACATLASLLELMGYLVRQAHDGQAAVDAAADFDPQVVLLDIGMPKLNGYEACRHIRDQPGGAARTIVACTGWGQADDRRRSDEAGFDQHLVKPVDPDVLFELLATVAARASA
ncbi:response regulator [Polaromonas sp.]|uniref:response regulator n=1 Tax=Polaromonas sp. TaxID=1869339 RepID=UPI0037511E65